MEVPIFGRMGNGSFEDVDLNDVFDEFYLEPGSEFEFIDVPSAKRASGLPKSLGISLSVGHTPANIPDRPEAPAATKATTGVLPKSLGIALSVGHKPANIPDRPEAPIAPKATTGVLPKSLGISLSVGHMPASIPARPEVPPESYPGGGGGLSSSALLTSSVPGAGLEVLSAPANFAEPSNGDPGDDQSERRARNREHAKKSRVRKKFLLEALQDQVAALQKDNQHLRHFIEEKMPTRARDIIQVCSSGAGAHVDVPSHGDLVDQDLTLMQALVSSQQTFTVSDPSLPDNPIVFASGGFLALTGYKMDEVLGRNCRFLQGPETDQRAVDEIRKGIEAGRDVSVCLKNYKADGTPFWNRFFVAALRDESGGIIRYVGVQSEVSTDERAKTGAKAGTDSTESPDPGHSIGIGQKRAFGH